MKRLVTVLLFAGASLAVMAQAPFTIFRPSDGSKVRETVHVKIPKDSVPPDGYLGIFIGGKFVEATLPPLDSTGKYYEYDLDTKARGIPDGQLTLEAVLYVDYADKPRIVNRSSVQVTVANTADNTIPASGLKLAYKWVPGTQMVYDFTSRSITAESDAALNSLGGKAVTNSREGEHFRILYAVDNAFADGSAIVHMQALPEKGKDHIMAITNVSPTEPSRYDLEEFAPIYQRLKADGLEVWGSRPFDLPMQGSAGTNPQSELYADFPLPTLPDKPVTVGSPWAARFQDGFFSPDPLAGSVVVRYPARGEFKGIEWELGHPCAKIVDSVSESLGSMHGGATGPKLSETETIWFALDRRQILKIVREKTTDAQVEMQGGFGEGAGGGASSSGGTGKAGLPPPGLLAGGGSGHLPPPSTDYQGAGTSAGVPPSGGQQLGAPGSAPSGGLGRQGGAPGSGGAARKITIRVTHEETFILEL
jgi:hypothetical protein